MPPPRLIVVLVAVSCLASTVHADVTLPALIGSNMVLQQGAAACVWGTADAGEKVTVEVCAQKVAATADDAGEWKVKLQPIKTGGPFDMTITGKNSIKLENVMFGEVWICSGQSNMAMSVHGSYNAFGEELEANYPNIRLFTVGRVTSDKPLKQVKGNWAPCSPDTVKYFSAVGYFFGRKIHQELGVPVGLINTSWGGTPAEAWTSAETLADDYYTPLHERWTAIIDGYPEAVKKYNEETIPAWKEAVAKAKAEGETPPRRPYAPQGPSSPHRPSNLYNAMIAPLLNSPIAGAIWYQGESNAGRAYQYRKLFSDMIQDWRAKWGQPEFPFFFVQLANFTAVAPQPGESAWAELREAQNMALALPKTGMAVIIEIGEATNIHPKNKQDVGKRLAMAALGVAYGKDVAWSSPLYDSMCIEGDKVRIKFKYAFDGLTTPNCAPVNGFAIAGVDRKFYWADAKIEGDGVVVWSKTVPKPVAVRHGWSNNPVCNLYNGAGLPASPFRTDTWPGLTVNNQ